MTKPTTYSKLLRQVTSRILLLIMIAGCSISPLGRSQLQLFSPDALAAMGDSAFDSIAAETPRIDDPAVNRYVACVADHLLETIPDTDAGNWELTVFDSPEKNAFALPGNKIGVFAGMLDTATTQDQLAAVIGHEIAHVVADHGNERVSTNFAADTGLQLASVIATNSAGTESQTLIALLGVGTQVGILLPFSRVQEEEADLLGLDYMAHAGFDPAASIELWKKMQVAADSATPPEILSTHPATGSRIADLSVRLPAATEAYRRARSSGQRPDCGAREMQ
jgi:predicted Zn-dependent protease